MMSNKYRFIALISFGFLYYNSVYASVAEDMLDKELEAKANASSRSVVVYFKNNSQCTLNRTKNELLEGIWIESPPHNIESSKWVVWATGSNGMITGTGGWVDYACQHGIAKIKWTNPFMGANAHNATYESIPRPTTDSSEQMNVISHHYIQESGEGEKYHPVVRFYLK